MERSIAFAASIVVNAVVLASLQWSVSETQQVPRGQVYITELSGEPAASLVRVGDDRGRSSVPL